MAKYIYDIGKLKEYLASIASYGADNKNYIIDAAHLQEVINSIEGLVTYLTSGVGANETIGSTDNDVINESEKGFYDSYSVEVSINRLKSYIDELVNQLQNGYIAKVDLSGNSAGFYNKLPAKHILLKGDDALTAENIHTGTGSSKTIAKELSDIITNFNSYTNGDTIHDQFIVVNLKTNVSDISPCTNCKSSNLNSDIISEDIDKGNPSSYEKVVKATVSSDSNKSDDVKVLNYNKEFAYGNYDLTLRVRAESSSGIVNAGNAGLVITIKSGETEIGTWNIYNSKITDKYTSFNIPFEHNGDMSTNTRKITIAVSVKNQNNYDANQVFYFDYLTINPITTTTYNEFIQEDSETAIHNLK